MNDQPESPTETCPARSIVDGHAVKCSLPKGHDEDHEYERESVHETPKSLRALAAPWNDGAHDLPPDLVDVLLAVVDPDNGKWHFQTGHLNSGKFWGTVDDEWYAPYLVYWMSIPVPAELRARAAEMEREPGPFAHEICICGHSAQSHAVGCAIPNCGCRGFQNRARSIIERHVPPARPQAKTEMEEEFARYTEAQIAGLKKWRTEHGLPQAQTAGKPTAGPYTVERSVLGTLYFIFQPTDGGQRIRVAEAYDQSVADFIAGAGTAYHETGLTANGLAEKNAVLRTQLEDALAELAEAHESMREAGGGAGEDRGVRH